jgi:lysophospholipase
VSDGAELNFVRAAQAISDEEKEWLEKRHEHTDEALKQFLDNAGFEDFDADEFIDGLNRSINIGLAFSGGGYRAMLNGAGQISALDNRTTGADEHGLAGLLQATTYLTGLSGGNWLTGTLALNNWTSVEEIISDDDIWDLENSIISPGGLNIFSTIGRWREVSDSIEGKRDAGFNTSLTDIWGRALSYQFFGEENAGSAGLTFTTLRDYEGFQNGEMPFPISVANGRTPGTLIINENSTVFEFNPFELGSWDPSLYAFTDLKYIGSNVSNGTPVVEDECIAGFDNAGFVLGTSSSLFNQFILQLNTTSLPSFIMNLIEGFLNDLSEDQDDIAIYEPNPFYKTEFARIDTIVDSEYLFLVDGGEDLQNVPLAPLIQPEREVDVIFAFDNSADTNDSFPNGASLVETYSRQFSSQGNGTAFPYVPGQGTFIHHNLTTKPTFFGCNSSNLTDLATIPPLVVYIANTPYSYWSNTSTFKMSYENEERNSMIQNGFEVASRYNLTIDPDWPKCVACAIIHREQERNGDQQSEECQQCFQDYCWDGSYDDDLDSTQSTNWTSTKDIGAPSSNSSETSTSTSSTASDESTESATSTDGASGSGDSDSSLAVHQYSEPISKLLLACVMASFAAALM